jgi:NADH-quinone oxidoreductase subunit C/D
MNDNPSVLDEMRARFPAVTFTPQTTCDGVPTLWLAAEQIPDVLRYLKSEAPQPYRMLYDITAIDERVRRFRNGQPDSDFTVVYQLLSFERCGHIRLKVPLKGEQLTVPSVTGLWANANWYERELWDMFGITPEGHPNLRRILMPPTWQGHPLRKDHAARATEMGPYHLDEHKEEVEEAALQFQPEDWGLSRQGPDEQFLFLNLGPQHPGTHGVFRIVLQLDGEEIINAIPDIGYHHRGAEKMGERQSWHTYIPYTDRVDYLSGVVNNLAYLLAVEQMAGIQVPERAKVIRIMLSELFRIINHLVFYGTFAQDMGALSPVFYMFTDRERAFEIIEAVCGFRMHPGWFRIGGVAADLPQGWDKMVRDFLDYLPPRLDEYDEMVMKNRIFRGRTVGVGQYTTDEAIEWGVTGPGLRATGMAWDLRKQMPYAGYDQFEFDIPTASNGDCYDRAVVHIAEMRESLRIIEQCLNNMPPGPYKSDHPLTTPPVKDYAMHDIETLINHFLGVSWGPVMPVTESFHAIEATKGNNGYYLVSDGATISYRTRIRTPSFPHLQMIPFMVNGSMISDLLAVLGSIDFVMSDVDR